MVQKQPLFERVGSWLGRFISPNRRERNRRGWDNRWAREDFDRPWLGRGVSREVIAAVEERWFAAEGAAIDLGCGEGDIAAWLAERGYRALGVDIAPAAVKRARARFGDGDGRLEFQAHDLCIAPPPGGPYRLLVDRGCYHQISQQDLAIYGRHLRQASTPDARLLLLHKAYRNGTSPGDAAERRRVTERVEEGLSEGFLIEKCEDTFMDPWHGANSERALPGLAYWMRRR